MSARSRSVRQVVSARCKEAQDMSREGSKEEGLKNTCEHGHQVLCCDRIPHGPRAGLRARQYRRYARIPALITTRAEILSPVRKGARQYHVRRYPGGQAGEEVQPGKSHRVCIVLRLRGAREMRGSCRK